jgi:protein TonB
LALGAFALGSCNYENKSVNTGVIENVTLGQLSPRADTTVLKNDSTVKEAKMGKIKPVHVEPIPDPSYIIQGEMPFEPELEVNAVNPDMVYNIVEQMPEFYGGSETLKLYVNSRLKNIENENELSGRIIVNFVVDENGVISNPKIIKSVQGLQDYEKAIIKVFNEMPKWRAGMQDGRNVKVEMNFPVEVVGE